MKTILVLTVETTIESRDEAEYERKRDALIAEFERKGYAVNVEAEEDPDDPDGDDSGEEE